MKERFKAIPAVYLILIKDNKVLLMRRFNTGYMDGYYGLPSGHVEAGESPIGAIIRESYEEVGVGISKENLKFAGIMYRAKHDETGERMDIFFKTSQWSGEPENKETEKCDELDWFDLNALPDNLIDYVKLAIVKSKDGVFYEEVDF